MSCGVGCRCGSDSALLWLWRRLAATAPIRPLAWEPPYATGAAQEMAKRKKNPYTFIYLTIFVYSSFFKSDLQHMEVPRLGVKLQLQLPALHHSHSNVGSELRLQATPQLTATPDP